MRHVCAVALVLAAPALACQPGGDATSDDATGEGATGEASTSAGSQATDAPQTTGGGDTTGGPTDTTTGGPAETTTDAMATDATDATDATGATGAAPLDRVPAFVAVGHVGRTTLSCDDGRSWIENHAYDLDGDPYTCDELAPVHCWQDGGACAIKSGDACETLSPCDCDHHPGAAQGVAYGGDYFVGTWGWGPPGTVRRSRDGITWEPVVQDTTFGGVAHGDGRFLLASREPRVSDDDGMSWGPGAPADVMQNGQTIWNVRAVGWAPAGGGRFVLTARDGDTLDVLLSSTGGDDWWRPAQPPVACAPFTRGITHGDDVILLVDGDGAACSSTSAGDAWTTSAIGGPIESNPIWTGTQFMAWGLQTAYSSPDGVNWSAQPVTPPGVQVGPAAIDPGTGTIVAVRGGWDVWYEDQVFYRSEDGITWEELDASAYTGGHPIRAIAFGYVDPSPACPLP
ncbi:MAG: hypothetical protein H6713_00905 [Myxococcales bacterium]|nr:hypothetical protein [Myxococcales bacterium]